MAGIFINYRSGPHSVIVGSLEDVLDRYFGSDQIFVDHQLTPGVPYPDELYTKLLGSDVLLAVIHDGWLGEFKEDQLDWVVFEIATAIAKGKAVIPVLIEDVDPPPRGKLPADISGLAVLQAARVRRATFRPDIDHLIQLLERHVAPVHVPKRRPIVTAKPKRVGRRFAAWASALFLISPILVTFNLYRPPWEWLAFAAFASTTLLVAASVLTMLLIPFKRLTYRWDVEAGTMSLREVTKRRWLVLAAAVLPLLYALSKVVPGKDGAWQEWEAWLLIAVVVGLLFFLHQTWRQYDARDYSWPPPVSTEPATFRRAAYRLHEKLTTDPDWGTFRSRANQREAVSVYLDLAELRRKLHTRATVSVAQWIKQGYSGEITVYLGWLTSILALEAVALVLLGSQDSAPPAVYLTIAGTVIAALVFTATKTIAEYYSDRRDVARWIKELTDWQAKIGPLVFCGSCAIAWPILLETETPDTAPTQQQC